MDCRLLLLALVCGAVTAKPQYDGAQPGGVGDKPGGVGGKPGGVGGKPGGVPAQCLHPSYDCVPYFQCHDGEIVVDGEGLIDIRTLPAATCVNPEYPGVPALCCLIPGEKPTPPPLDKCDYPLECVDYNQCDADGNVVTDGSDLIDIRVYTRPNCWTPAGSVGTCCNPPPPPPLDYCPVDSKCVPVGLCTGTQYNYDNAWVDPLTYTGDFQQCYLPTDQLGVCCKSSLIEFCPVESQCLHDYECQGQAMVEGTTDFVDYVFGGADTYAKCQLPDFAAGGLCCINRVIVDYCPADSQCVYEYECQSNIYSDQSTWVSYSSGGKWSECQLPGGDYGVCCQKTALDYCPGDSQCVYADQCQGNIYSTAETWEPFNAAGQWSECVLGNEYGVCCQAVGHCGVGYQQIDTRITPGNAPGHNDARFGEFPWQAIIFYQNYTYVCGAVLISDQFLLTAAHCVDDGIYPADIKIRLGEYQVNSFDEPLKYEDYNVIDIKIHNSFNPKNVHNDIAVLELEYPITFNYHINAVCLPSQGYAVPPGTRCFASGWGKDSFNGNYQHVLKKIDLPMIDKDTCQNLLRKTRLGKWFRLDKSFICAGGEENKDACSGDGGGPLMCQDPVTGYYTVVGLTAWGIDCGQIDIPGVYVDVGHFAGWIDAHTVKGPGVKAK